MKKICLIIFLQFYFLNAKGQTKHSSDNNQILYIPVVFHVVHKSPYDISAEQLTQLVKKINNGFNTVESLKIDPYYRNLIANCNIQFYIPKSNKNCDSDFSPISWHIVNKDFYTKSLTSQISLMSNGYKSHKKYLNIWICKLKGTIGYGIHPNGTLMEKLGRDGVVIDIDVILNNPAPLIHEIGHYLDLNHIWEKAKGVFSNPRSLDCSDDDGIRDTPQQAGANYRNKGDAGSDNVFQFDEIQKVCGDSTTAGNYQNFMDYSYETVSMFTKGQKTKMRFTILEKRKDLLWKSDCNNVLVNNNGMVNYNSPKYIINLKFINKRTYNVIEKEVGNSKISGSFEIPNGKYSLEIYHYRLIKKKKSSRQSQFLKGKRVKVVNATANSIIIKRNTNLKITVRDNIDIVVTNDGQYVPIHINQNSSTNPQPAKEGNTLKRFLDKNKGIDEYNKKRKQGMDDYNKENEKLQRKLKNKYGF